MNPDSNNDDGIDAMAEDQSSFDGVKQRRALLIYDSGHVNLINTYMRPELEGLHYEVHDLKFDDLPSLNLNYLHEKVHRSDIVIAIITNVESALPGLKIISGLHVEYVAKPFLYFSTNPELVRSRMGPDFETKELLLEHWKKTKHVFRESMLNAQSELEDVDQVPAPEDLGLEQANALPNHLFKKNLIISAVGADDYDAVDALFSGPETWRCGPSVRKGDYVLIYFPKGAAELEKSNELKDGLRFILVAAEDGSPAPEESRWRTEFPVSEVIELERPIRRKDLDNHSVLREWKLPRTNFKGAGQLKEPLDFEIKDALWRLILELNPELTGKFVPNDAFQLRNLVSKDTWTTDDDLGYSIYATAIADSMLSGATAPPLTIGILAPWGHGKTSLMKMIQDKLEPGSSETDPRKPRTKQSGAVVTTYKELFAFLKSKESDSSEKKKSGLLFKNKENEIPTVWFNPLYYMEKEQIWAGLAHDMLNQLVNKLPTQAEREKFWLRLQISRINASSIRRSFHKRIVIDFIPWAVAFSALFALSVVLSITGHFPGLAAFSSSGSILGGIVIFLYKYFREHRATLSEKYESLVSEPNYDSKLGFLHLVDHDISEALKILVGEKPIAIFIDDLDRCDPDTVAEIILAMNQFLSLPRRNVYFILGMDMTEVADALERAKGFGHDRQRDKGFGWAFMEKFVQLPFAIPQLSSETAATFTSKHIGGRETLSSSGPSPETRNQSHQELEDRILEAKSAEELVKVSDEVGKAGVEMHEESELRNALASQANKFLKDPQSKEIQRITEIALEDLTLSPRAIKRYFSLVRIMRSVQIASGQGTGDHDRDRLLVLRAAHFHILWPDLVQRLKVRPKIQRTDGTWVDSVPLIEDRRPWPIARWTHGLRLCQDSVWIA
jgi:hypothetical protein